MSWSVWRSRRGICVVLLCVVDGRCYWFHCDGRVSTGYVGNERIETIEASWNEIGWFRIE